MSTAQPAPWKIGLHSQIVDAEGRQVQITGFALGSGGDADDRRQRECNTLVAMAGPDLFKALKACLSDDKEFGYMTIDTEEQAKKAIAKAEVPK